MSGGQTINRSQRNMSTKDATNSVQEVDKSKTAKSSNGVPAVLQLFSAIALGITFGFFMNKANIYLAPIIRDQMIFKRLAMLKMFLGAVGMSMITAFVVLLFNESIYQNTLKAFIHRNNRINALHIIVGGSLLGVGMVLAGSCPGTVFVQMGAGLPNSLLTFLGGLCGVIFYYSFLFKTLTKYELPVSSTVLQQLPDMMGIKRLSLTLMLGLILITFSFILEYVFPNQKDLNQITISYDVENWLPTVCGMVIGLLQLFFMIIYQKSLGISTGFSVMAAQLCRVPFFKQLLPSLESFMHGVQNGVSLLFAIGAIVGSCASTVSKGQFPLSNEYGANALASFMGGFFLLVGSRCAGGCTSGQGISGFTHLMIGSIIATASIFGGGILFAVSYGLATNDWQFNGL